MVSNIKYIFCMSLMKVMLFINQEQARGIISAEGDKDFETCFNTPHAALCVTKELIFKTLSQEVV